MTQTQIQWMTKDSSGTLRGPFTTDAIIKLISQGVFVGGEFISQVPNGAWMKITKEPQFYDKLLEAIEVSASADEDISKALFSKMAADTIVQKVTPEKDLSSNHSIFKKDENLESTQKIESNTSESPFFNHLDHFSQATSSKNALISTNPSSSPHESTKFSNKEFEASTKNKIASPEVVLELNNLKELQNKKFKNNVIFIFGLGLIVSLFGFFYFLEEEDLAKDKIRLITPNISNGSNLSKEETIKTIQSATKSFEQDNVESYLEAQNKLVGLIEQVPSYEEARGLLCLVYKELWPFSHQDSEDVKAISFIAQSTRAINPIGINGYYCEIVKLLTMGRYSEAFGTVEQALEIKDNTGRTLYSNYPVLMALKGEMHAADSRTFKEASYYLDSAIRLWPEWIHPRAVLADLYKKRVQIKEAVNLYKGILQVNPTHKLSKINLGIINYQHLRQPDEAFALLSSTLQNKNKVNSITEALGYVTFAKILSDRGEQKKALEFAKKGLHIYPTNPEAQQLVIQLGGSVSEENKSIQNFELLTLGDQYQRSGDCLAAQAEYKAAFELNPKNAQAALRAAKCLWNLNQSQESIDWLSKAVKADSKLIDAYVTQADYLSQRYDYIKADSILKMAKSEVGNNVEIHKAYSLLEYRRNNMNAALDYAQKALKIYDNDVETIILLSKSFYGRAEYKEAFRYAVKAIELDGSNVESQKNYAIVLSKFQGIESGILYLNDLIQKYQHTLDYRETLANMLKEEFRLKEAAFAYEQLVEQSPKYKKAMMGLADTYQKLGLFDKSVKVYFKSAVLDPTDAEPLFKAGILYFETGQYQEAIKQFTRVLKVNPFFPRVNYYIGKSLFQLKDYEQALRSALEERRLNPNIADSYLLAAEIYDVKGSLDKCATEYQKASKLRPQGTEIYIKMASCYRRNGELDIAEGMLNVAASKESGFADIYREQGMIFEARGDRAHAKCSYQLYLELSPNAPDREQISARAERVTPENVDCRRN